jgi:HSP20 family protein
MADTKTEVAVKRDAVPAQIADWEPLRSLRHQIDRMLSDFDWPDLRFGRPHRSVYGAPLWPDLAVEIPAVDFVERNGGYEMQAELPGLSPDQIEVRLSDGLMTIKGEKSAERVEDAQNYHLRERSFGSFQRTFRVPASVDTSKIEAQFDNGVLKVSLPKSATAIEQERKIEVKTS